MNIAERITDLEWTFGCILDAHALTEQAVLAAKQYATWGLFANRQPEQAITASLTLTDSEWGVIQPLAALYVEQENARALEASSNNGVTVYGRSVAEVSSAIELYLLERLPQLAFQCAMETV